MKTTVSNFDFSIISRLNLYIKKMPFNMGVDPYMTYNLELVSPKGEVTEERHIFV